MWREIFLGVDVHRNIRDAEQCPGHGTHAASAAAAQDGDELNQRRGREDDRWEPTGNADDMGVHSLISLFPDSQPFSSPAIVAGANSRSAGGLRGYDIGTT